MEKRNKAIKNLKLFFLFFFFSILFSWGINILQLETEDYIYNQKMAGQSQLQANIVSLALPNAFRPIEKEKNQPLEITAESALTVYINGEKEEFVLFEKNSQIVRPIASLTKLITALTVLDIYQSNDIIRISSEAVKQEGVKGYLKADEFISVEDLLKIMLIESSNDAAFAFASHHFSEEKITPDAFKNLMNLEVEHNIGLNPENTYFQNPSGLDPSNGIKEINHSTAKDLFEITKYILREQPKILEILSIPEITVAGRYLTTTNELLAEYPKIIGGKTGYTERAGGCLALVLEAPGENSYFINIILGSKERFEDMRKMIEWQKKSYLFR